MAAPLQAQYETLFGLAFVAGTPTLAFHGRGDTLWRRSEFPGTATTWNGKNTSYTVLDIELVTFDDAGTERFADATLTTEVTNAGTQPTDATVGYFYSIQHNTTGKVTRRVHESDLANEAAIETLLGTNAAAFIAP